MLETLVNYRRYLKVANHIPGRIRIKFSTDLLRQPEVEKWIKSSSAKNPIIDELLPVLSGKTVQPTMLPGIQSVRLNPLGRSIAIHYDTDFFKPGWIDEALSTKDSVRFMVMVEELIAQYKN